ncbi:MAG TPA: nuclear transport factor 2 family protein [Allosphingosinicella sp.]|jgi:hypothetical protein|nr:nuclear transport factor 2 family protein [Allosphingosinicella sp.]
MILLAMILAAAPVPAADEAAVLAVAEEMLGTLKSKDSAKMLALTLPEGGATAVGEGKLHHFSWAQFVEHLPKDPNVVVEERLFDPLVRVDGDVAVVWGRYDVSVNGKFLHCGTDHFDMVRTGGKWRILNITWNQVTEGCTK